MRAWVVPALAASLWTTAAGADDLQKAHAAVNALLQKNGGGLVSFQAACPKKATDSSEFASSSVVVSLDETSSAALINTGMCDGGNGRGQFLVIVQKGTPHVVSDIDLGDMSFIGLTMNGDADSLEVYGDRWLKSDPHCCPSKTAMLEYDLKTHQHKLTIVGDNKE